MIGRPLIIDGPVEQYVLWEINSSKRWIPYVCGYALAVTICLAFVGAALDETLAVIHWIEEIVNIIGMITLCIGGYLTFRTQEQD